MLTEVQKCLNDM